MNIRIYLHFRRIVINTDMGVRWTRSIVSVNDRIADVYDELLVPLHRDHVGIGQLCKIQLPFFQLEPALRPITFRRLETCPSTPESQHIIASLSPLEVYGEELA